METNAANWQRKQNAANNFSAVLPYDMEQQRKETTPLAMMVAGFSVAQTDILKMCTKLRVYFSCFLKLVLIPDVYKRQGTIICK